MGSATRSVSAISDSGMPKSRSIRCSYVVRPAVAAANSSLATAAGHIACSSRGGPGITTIVGPSRPSAGGTTSPGAVPAGSITNEPSGHDRLLAVRRPDGVEVEVAPALHERPEDVGDLLLELLVEHHLAALEGAHDLRGQVVGGRPEAAARDDQVDALVGHEAELRLHVARPVAADRDVRQLDPQLEQPVGEPRPVAVLDPAR